MRVPAPFRRVSLSSLMGLVGLSAIGFAAVHNATELWAGSLYTLAQAALVLAILLAIYRRDRKRAFWVRLCGIRMGCPSQRLWPLGGTAHEHNASPDRTPLATI
jgi:hypothetical protein